MLHLIKNISAEASSDNGFGNESLETVPQINRTDKDDPNEKFQKAFDAVRKVGEMTVIKRIQKKAFNLELKSEFEDQDTIIKRIAQTIIEERYKAPVRLIDFFSCFVSIRSLFRFFPYIS